MCVYYGAELTAISKKSGLDLGRLVLLQLVYEASTACTSVVVSDSKETPHHIRTMDWDMDFMKLDPFTIEIDFQKGGKTCFVCTSWAGYVGVLTGMKPFGWSVSVNFRATVGGSFWTNVQKAFGGGWPVGFLVRDALEYENTFSEAKARLTDSVLIAPCYLTMAGTLEKEGALLTRSVKVTENPLVLDNEKGFLVQANMDHWTEEENQDIMDSRERRNLMARMLSSKKKDCDDIQETLWNYMSQSPICNSITIYATYMCPSSGVYQTLLPEKRTAFLGSSAKHGPDGFSVRVPTNQQLAGKDVQLRTVPPAVYLCQNCPDSFDYFRNKGGCVHLKGWHSAFGDCNYAKCGFGLGPSNIGSQHWGCCFGLDSSNLACSSNPHVLKVDKN